MKAKTRLREVCLGAFLFADDAAVHIHTEEKLLQRIQRFIVACEDFGLIISLNKTQVMGQDVDAPPFISICDYALGSTITDNLSLETWLNRSIGKVAITLSGLTTKSLDKQ